jgi:hypothetical protein
MAAGSIVALAGLAIRAWASGHLMKNEELAMSGPYAYTRNPLYLGTLLLGFGIALCTASWWFVCIFAAFYLIIYIPVMLAEARTLRELFPGQYQTYSDRVPLLVPKLRVHDLGVKVMETTNCDVPKRFFDLSLYLRHREYRALIGFLAAVVILVLKTRLLR